MKSILLNLIITLILFLSLIAENVWASGREVIGLAEMHMGNGEYYNAITELMRYQHLYPEGKYYPVSLLMMGKAYFGGQNYSQAFSKLELCYSKYKDLPEGEEALYRKAHLRLLIGSPFFAYRTYTEYEYIYGNSKFSENTTAESCYALTLINELDDAKKKIESYRERFPEGKYIDKLRELEIMISEEEKRPRKNIWVSLIGSIFVPGFGHFYAGKTSTGVFSLFTNAALIYLIYDGYRDDDRFQMFFFAFLELSFYQHSLYSSMRNVYEYNSNKNFRKRINMAITRNF